MVIYFEVLNKQMLLPCQTKVRTKLISQDLPQSFKLSNFPPDLLSPSRFFFKTPEFPAKSLVSFFQYVNISLNLILDFFVGEFNPKLSSKIIPPPPAFLLGLCRTDVSKVFLATIYGCRQFPRITPWSRGGIYSWEKLVYKGCS